MKCVIFDLDGTLADTSGDLIAAANACFRARGLGDLLDREADQLTAFHGGRAMLTLGFERAGVDLAAVDEDYPRLLEHYRDNIDVHTQLYPGAVEAVKALRAEGYALGVCTNKPEALAELLLQKLGVRDLFASLVGADTFPVRKPDPVPLVAAVERAGGDLAKTVLIGDTETDVKTGDATGVPVVLVAFGPEGTGVARLTPDALLPEYGQLGRIVEVLIG
ncbi:MAG: HAD-IA family hydrolase [Silicimonas sp.]|nr:HAD-IA family hydrolase [Silicimonas sp.]